MRIANAIRLAANNGKQLSQYNEMDEQRHRLNAGRLLKVRRLLSRMAVMRAQALEWDRLRLKCIASKFAGVAEILVLYSANDSIECILHAKEAPPFDSLEW